MAMPKKDGIKVNYKLSREIVEMLNKYCEGTGLSKTKVVEKALKEYFEKHTGDK